MRKLQAVNKRMFLFIFHSHLSAQLENIFDYIDTEIKSWSQPISFPFSNNAWTVFKRADLFINYSQNN